MKQQSDQFGISHLVLPLIIMVAAIGGGGYYVSHHHKSLNSNDQHGSTISENLPDQLLGVDKITQLATTSNSGKTVSAIKLEKEGNQFVYKVRLDDGSVVVFDALTGQQLNRDTQTENEDEQELKDVSDLEDNFTPKVDIDQAMSIAQDAHAGTIKDIELSGDNGGVYKIEYSDGTKVKVSAENGKIVSLKTPDSHKQQKKGSGSGGDSQGSSDNTSEDNHKGSGSSGSSGSSGGSSHDNNNDNNNDGGGDNGSGSSSGGDSGGDHGGSGGGDDGSDH